jgi:hypothetical protein
MNDKGNFGVIAWPLLLRVKINIAWVKKKNQCFNIFKIEA